MSIQTSDLERAEVTVQTHTTVRDAQVVDSDHGATPQALEVVLEERVERVPPGVLRLLANHDCGISEVQPQGQHLIVEVI